MAADTPLAAARNPLAADSSPWLHGRALDLLVGAGFGYIASIPLLLLLGSSTGLQGWPFFWVWLLGFAINAPHYGATLLRVYEQRNERRKYAVFSVWLTLGVAALFVAGVYDPLLGSALLTAYVTWSPWHFAGQNYGLSLMFLRRRGIAVEAPVKRLLWASFFLSFVLATLALHAEGSTSIFAARAGNVGELSVLRAHIPTSIAYAGFVVAGAAYLITLGIAAARLLRVARPSDLLPAGCLVVSQALWFSVPALLAVAGLLTAEGLVFAAVWISTAHSAQYLWVTSYYAKRTDPSTRTGPYLAKTFLAGNAVLVLPGLLVAPDLLGSLSWDAGLGLLIYSAVNVHHFILDGAVWKLRDGPVARALLRAGAPSQAEAVAPARSRRRVWVPALIWTAGAVCIAVQVGEASWPAAFNRGRYLETSAILDSLAWFGRDDAQMRILIARRLTRRGEIDAALLQYERSLALRPNATAFGEAAQLHERRGDLAAAVEAYQAGLELTEHPRLRQKLRRAQRRLDRSSRSPR